MFYLYIHPPSTSCIAKIVVSISLKLILMVKEPSALFQPGPEDVISRMERTGGKVCNTISLRLVQKERDKKSARRSGPDGCGWEGG